MSHSPINRMPEIRTYRGVTIFPKNVYGMYSAVVRCTPLAADTLKGMRRLIRETLKEGE